jgi:hypothetical protein
MGVAVKTTVPPEQTGFSDAAIETLTGWTGLTDMVTEFDWTTLTDAHGEFEVSWQVTICPLTGMNMNVGEFPPTFPPFTFHWYAGDDPPFEIVAVKVTCAPWQAGLFGVEIVMLGVTVALTVMVIALDEAGFPVIHGEFEVSWHDTTSFGVGV